MFRKNKIKVFIINILLIFGFLLFANSIIGLNKFTTLKSLFSESQKVFIKKNFFPYKFIGELQSNLISIKNKEGNLQEQVKVLESQRNQFHNKSLIIKSDGDLNFELNPDNKIYIYNSGERERIQPLKFMNKKLKIKIIGVIKDKNIICYEKKDTQTHIINMNDFSQECRNSIYFIGQVNNDYFYSAFEQNKKKENKFLLVLPTSNFYNYSGNQLNVNQYSAANDYIANLNEVPLNGTMNLALKTSDSIHNIYSLVDDFDVIPDYKFEKLNLDKYKGIFFPMHQEYVSNNFINKFKDFLKKEDRFVLSIGGSNFMREVEFQEKNILYKKNMLIDEKQNLNTFDGRKNKNCRYIDDETMDLGELTEPRIKNSIQYLYPKIKCDDNKNLPLMSIQRFYDKESGKFFHINSDGIGLSFTKINNLRSILSNEINRI